jgi:hypothetical protein
MKDEADSPSAHRYREAVEGGKVYRVFFFKWLSKQGLRGRV